MDIKTAPNRASSTLGLNALSSIGFVLVFSLFLSACSSDKESDSPPVVDSFNLESVTTDEEFIENYKALLRESVARDRPQPVGLEPVIEPALETAVDVLSVAEMDSGSGTQERSLSDTNTVVDGVDELDYVKTDGSIIFALNQTTEQTDGIWLRRYGVNIVDVSGDEPQTLKRIELGDAYPRGFYLRSTSDAERQVVSLSSNYGYFAYRDIAPIVDSGYTEITVVNDVLDATTPTSDLTQVLRIKGSLLTSRVVGNRLILVSGYTPYIPILTPEPLTADHESANFGSVDALTRDDILPSYTLPSGEERPLVLPRHCFVFKDDRAHYGYPQIMTISSINLDDLSDIQSSCMTSYASAFHVTQDSIYLSEYGPKQSRIHKFDFNENDISYVGSGSVPGYVRGGSYSFMMHEQNDNLFVISSMWLSDLRRQEHHLSVLGNPIDESADKQLETLGRIPNDTRPESIGKPGEDIFGVRYIDDMAYVVTFERIDPLYAIDLSNPEDPFIAGELELPGFSDYLHPLPNDLLLGVGSTGQWPQQIVVNLFDISNDAEPRLLRQNTLENWTGAWAPLRYDHHAFATQTSEDTSSAKAAFPFNFYGAFDWNVLADGALVADAPVSTNAVAMMEVDTLNQSFSLFGAKNIAPEAADYFYQRVILAGERYYYVSNGSVHEGEWGVLD